MLLAWDWNTHVDYHIIIKVACDIMALPGTNETSSV